jgi:hypothetical protein
MALARKTNGLNDFCFSFFSIAYFRNTVNPELTTTSRTKIGQKILSNKLEVSEIGASGFTFSLFSDVLELSIILFLQLKVVIL